MGAHKFMDPTIIKGGDQFKIVVANGRRLPGQWKHRVNIFFLGLGICVISTSMICIGDQFYKISPLLFYRQVMLSSLKPDL